MISIPSKESASQGGWPLERFPMLVPTDGFAADRKPGALGNFLRALSSSPESAYTKSIRLFHPAACSEAGAFPYLRRPSRASPPTMVTKSSLVETTKLESSTSTAVVVKDHGDSASAS